MFPTLYNHFESPYHGDSRAQSSSHQPSHPTKRTQDPIVTGTSILGIKYDGGVLLAADTLGSYGSLARFRSLERLKAVGSTTIVGASGEYSDFQYIQKLLEDLTYVVLECIQIDILIIIVFFLS